MNKNAFRFEKAQTFTLCKWIKMHSRLKRIYFNIHESVFLKIWIWKSENFNLFQSILVCWIAFQNTWGSYKIFENSESTLRKSLGTLALTIQFINIYQFIEFLRVFFLWEISPSHDGIHENDILLDFYCQFCVQFVAFLQSKISSKN